MSTELKHVISADQFLDAELVNDIFERADFFEQRSREGNLHKSLEDKRVVGLFYEPSTRTRLSFQLAAHNLGAYPAFTENAGSYSSAIKGETLEDSIRTVTAYSNIGAVVLRSDEKGGAARAAEVTDTPIINAGDGDGEHPTQALLDLYTMRKLFPEMDGLKIAFAGDLKFGRTVHSLAKLTKYLHPETKLYGVSPKSLQLPDEYVPEGFIQTDNLEEVIGEVDALYMLRVQKERFKSKRHYRRVKSKLILDSALMARAKPGMKLFHPLPKVDEIAKEIDFDPRAVYFSEQIPSGEWVRTALIDKVAV